MVALVLEINEAKSINLVIGDNLLLQARKVLSSSGLPSSQSGLVAEIRNICDVTGPEVFHCEGEWTMN